MDFKPYFIMVIVLAVFIVSFMGLTLKYGIPPTQPISVKKFVEYSQMIENNIPVEICIETQHYTAFSSVCSKSINITNIQQLIMYINKEYNTDVMRDLERYKRAYKAYRQRQEQK